MDRRKVNLRNTYPVAITGAGVDDSSGERIVWPSILLFKVDDAARIEVSRLVAHSLQQPFVFSSLPPEPHGEHVTVKPSRRIFEFRASGLLLSR